MIIDNRSVTIMKVTAHSECATAAGMLHTSNPGASLHFIWDDTQAKPSLQGNRLRSDAGLYYDLAGISQCYKRNAEAFMQLAMRSESPGRQANICMYPAKSLRDQHTAYLLPDRHAQR